MPAKEIQDTEVFSNPLDSDGEESAEDSGISTAATDVLEDSAPNDVGAEAVQESGVSTAVTDVSDDSAPADVGVQSLADTSLTAAGDNFILRQEEPMAAFEKELAEFGQQRPLLTRELPTNKDWMDLEVEEDEYLGITPTGPAYTYKYHKRKRTEYMAGVSFGVWSTSSNMRQTVFVCVQSRPFEAFILMAISSQAILMALTTAGDHAASLEKFPQLDRILSISEQVFLLVYTFEMGMKMVALGVYKGKHAYFRGAWNTVDGFLVLFGWFYIIVKLIGMQHLVNPSIVRLVRCLRPLRTMSFMQGVRAALRSWPYLIDTGLLLSIALALFGVIGVQLYGGTRSYVCTDFSNVSCPVQLACETQACLAVPRSDAPVWGFDNIFQAFLSGWVAMTGDMWTPNMVGVYAESNSKYAQGAWFFFIFWSVLLNLVFGNLFTAVIINSFLDNHRQVSNPRDVADRIKKEITLFNRIDTDLTGTIAVSELETLAAILELDDDLFTRDELQQACQEMDVTGDGTVDFEEFTSFWEANSPFVVKLKKALRRQENTVREAWEIIDADGSGMLDKDEILAMAQLMHIELSDQELAAAMDEMDAHDDEVDFSTFSNWWLGSSKVAAKVKAASKIQESMNESTRMFLRMDTDGSEGLALDEIIESTRLAFSRALTDEECSILFEEALPIGATEGSEIFVEDFERWWKSSDTGLVQQLREERRAESIKIRGFVEGLSAVENQLLSTSVKDPRPGNFLQRDALEEIESILKLKCKVSDLVSSIERTRTSAPGSADAAVSDLESPSKSDLRSSSMSSSSSAATSAAAEASLQEFTEWIISPEPLAEKAMAELDELLVARQLALDRPFPFVPGVSPTCSSLNKSSGFDKFMIFVIVVNTAFMATAHHEQEKTSPQLTKFVADSEVVFAFVYASEVIIRTFGMGFKAYFSDASCIFDFSCTVAMFVGYIVPGAGNAAAFRSLRVLTKCLRIARSATILLRAEQVQYLIKTVMAESRDVSLLLIFMLFMLILASVVAGHTLGTCHIHADGTVNSDLPKVNFFTFWQSFHASFLIMMGARWSEIMYDYMDPGRDLGLSDTCTKTSWLFFVMCFAALKFFAGNLFVAMIIDGFTLSESEKLVKQEKNHLMSMAEESNILREMGMGSGNSLGGVVDGFKAMREGGAQDVLLDGLKEVPKPADVMKMMSSSARVKKLSGPMAQMKKEMGRQGNKLNTLADKASGGQLKKLQEEAEQRLKAVQEEMEHLAQEAKKNAVDASSKAATMAATTAMEKLDEAKKRAEAGLAEAAARLDEQMTEQAATMQNKKTPEELKQEASWNIFSVENGIRKLCMRTVDNPHFEPIVLALICVSGVSIAAEGPPGNHTLDDKPLLRNMFHAINIGILVVFWMEFLLHTVAEGFISTPSAYLKKAWHRMDFFILIVSSIEFAYSYIGEGDAVRILRVVRVWRPLQLLKHNNAITVLLEALASVLPVMGGVLALMLIFYTSFAIFGTGVFMGTFASCNCDGRWALPATNCTSSDFDALGKEDCIAQGGTWENPPYNFDSFSNSMKTLFYASTGGLKTIMLTAMDSTEADKAPQDQASFFSASFFWVFSLANQYFLQNLLVGLLCNYFLQASGSALLTRSQQQWAQCQIFVLTAQPYVNPPPAKETARRYVYDIVILPTFDFAITVAVCVNVTVLLLESVPQDETVAAVTKVVQDVCMVVFSADMAMSAFAHGWSDYWKDPWSKLDVVIVLSSWIAVLFDISWISAIRGVRMFRVLTLVKRFKSLKPITRSMLMSIPGCMNVAGVVFLFLFILAVSAMNLYGGPSVPHGDTRYGIDARNNFDSFPNALMFLCQMVSGHPYMHVVYELENRDQPFPFLFFAVFTIGMQWVLINLFVVILLDNFTKCFVVAQMDISEDHVALFKDVWTESKTDPGGLFGGKPFTTKPDCKDMDVRMLEEFVPMLLPPTETLDTHLHSATSATGVATGVATGSLKLFQAIDISPLGMLVPHRVKHSTELAMPFEQGQIGHVNGQLVEVLAARWDSDMAREEGVPPSAVSVKYLESDEIDATRMLGEDGMHVPPVEKMVGLVDGKRYEITWVSNDRARIRVQKATGRKKRFASNRIKQSNGTPDWLTKGRPESPSAEYEHYTPEEEQEREEASIKLQASYRGHMSRKQTKRRSEDAVGATSENKNIAFLSIDGGAGKMGTIETLAPSDVRKVSVEGDQFWLNRLIVELGISLPEAVDGFRYLPDGVKLTDDDGRFLPVVVGLRALPTGQFVQDVRVGFHELLLALSLIQMSYGGLNYQERQAKLDKLRKRGEDYAARIFQTCARCKFSKRHLVKSPPTLTGKPLKRWSKYHSINGKFDSFSDFKCVQRMLMLDAVRDGLLSSMKDVFSIKSTVAGHQLD